MSLRSGPKVYSILICVYKILIAIETCFLLRLALIEANYLKRKDFEEHIGKQCAGNSMAGINGGERKTRSVERALWAGNLQVSERSRTVVPEVQGLPAHLHAVRQARCDVSGLPEPHPRRRSYI